MTTKEAGELIVKLMDLHNLSSWSYSFDRAQRRLGYCEYDKKNISLSRTFIELNTEDKIRNTILHEIAHALVGKGNGHNATWRFKALSIGCSGQRCSGNVNRVPGRYAVACELCGNTFGDYIRRPKSNLSQSWHSKCGRAGIGKLKLVIKAGK